jgi:hypothetical protein
VIPNSEIFEVRHLQNLKTFLQIDKKRIRNAEFINFVNAELQRFPNLESLSKESVQTMYAVKFCEVRVRGTNISFIDQASWGNDMIYFEDKKE